MTKCILYVTLFIPQKSTILHHFQNVIQFLNQLDHECSLLGIITHNCYSVGYNLRNLFDILL